MSYLSYTNGIPPVVILSRQCSTSRTGGAFWLKSRYRTWGPSSVKSGVLEGFGQWRAKLAPARRRSLESSQAECPTYKTFGKLCRWLEVDPATLLDVTQQPTETAPTNIAVAHLKAHREIDPKTASALANAILKAQLMLHDAPGKVGEVDGEGL